MIDVPRPTIVAAMADHQQRTRVERIQEMNVNYPFSSSSAAASGRRFTHLPPDAVAGPQLSHYPFTLRRYFPLLLPNPSLNETQENEASWHQ